MRTVTTLPNIAQAAAKLRIAREIDKCTGQSQMVEALKSDAPLTEKIDMLRDQYFDTINKESARNGLYVTLGRPLYEAVRDYFERYE